MTLATSPKAGRRGDLNAAINEAKGSPFRSAHEASVASRWERHPTNLRALVRELMEAWQAELPTRLHNGGVEWEPGDGGSKLGTPRWTDAFRAYVTGNDCDSTKDGDWRWPLRSSLFRLSISRSGTDQAAAAFCWLLIHHRYSVREAWDAQRGPFADPSIAAVAETWAEGALQRWWRWYVQTPAGGQR